MQLFKLIYITATSLQHRIRVCLTRRSAGTRTCARHQTFMQVKQLDLKTFHETTWANMFSFRLTHTPSWQTLGFQILNRPPCWSELLRVPAGESMHNRHPPRVNAYILLRRRVAPETRRGYPSRSAEKMRTCPVSLFVRDGLFVWIMLLSGRNMQGLVWLSPPGCGGSLARGHCGNQQPRGVGFCSESWWFKSPDHVGYYWEQV